jgi:hypothetical protein
MPDIMPYETSQHTLEQQFQILDRLDALGGYQSESK